MVVIAAASALAALVGAPPAAAAPSADACLAAHTSAQQLRKLGKLEAAHRELLVCAAPTCPQLVAADCTTWVAEVERDIPSILPVVRDRSGREISRVRVRVDGEVVRPLIDGRPIELDPGSHTIRFEPEEGEPVEVELLARVGEKNRSLPVTLTSADVDPLRAAAWVTGSAAVTALAIFAGLAISGQAQYDELEACRPGCAQAEEDAVRTKFLVADVSLVVGLAALAGSATLFVLSIHDDDVPAATIRIAPHAGPSRGGLDVSARF
jgi:hypothetical protein